MATAVGLLAMAAMIAKASPPQQGPTDKSRWNGGIADRHGPDQSHRGVPPGADWRAKPAGTGVPSYGPPLLPPTSGSFWFQRPYPYHLDYYRMRYGGGYDPYFGNLYGPPRVYAPSYGYPGGFGLYAPFGPQPAYGNGYAGAYYW